MSKNQHLKIKEFCAAMEHLAPMGTAEKWDNVGLLCGDPDACITGAIVSIDLTKEAIEQAKAEGYNLIVNHHAAIFPKQKGLSSITPTGKTALLWDALQGGIAVYACHTNFDRSALDAMEWLSGALGFHPVGRLHSEDEDPLRKLVVFVPTTHLQIVSEALFRAGAGKIGDYDSCGFSTEGTGTFRGSKHSKPFIGKPEKLTRAKEFRLETVFPQGLEKSILTALSESHPYEEIAYDLYRIQQKPGMKGWVKGLGYGFVGEREKALDYDSFLQTVYDVFQVSALMVSLPQPKTVKRIGFSPGEGSSFVQAAMKAKCDVFITGETGYHHSREAALGGMQVLEVGHRESEIAFLLTAEKWLKSFSIRNIKILNLPVQRILQDGRSLGSRKGSGRKVRAP